MWGFRLYFGAKAVHDGLVKWELEKLFYQGNHRRVLDVTVDSSDGDCNVENCAFVVGALAFLGRREEARWWLNRYQSKLPDEALAQALFYVAVGLCRHSHNLEARAEFTRLLLDYRRSTFARCRFFAFQGVAFYR